MSYAASSRRNPALGRMDTSMDPVQEARALVQALNAPGNSANASSIQERLLQLQKSDAGWNIANGLLGSEDRTDRFYGALTLTIRIHQDWETLEEDDRRALLVRLMNCFVGLAHSEEAPFVMRKMMATLSTYYFKPNAPWQHVIRHTALCLANGNYIPEEGCTQDALAMAVRSMNCKVLHLLLSFSRTIAEDSGSVTGANDTAPKLEARNRLHSNVHDAINIVDFAVIVILSSLDTPQTSRSVDDEQLYDTAKEAIRSMNAWVNVARAPGTTTSGLKETTTGPLSRVIRFLGVEAVAPTLMEMLTDILTHQPALIDEDQLQGILNFLSGTLGETYALALLGGDFDNDAMQFLELLMAYASNDPLQLLTEQPTAQTERVIFLLHTLFRVPGFAEVDEKVSTLLLEFWTNAADEMGDALMENEVKIVPDKFNMELAQAMNDCYPKLCYPDANAVQGWDEDERRNFCGFRRDFADFLLIAYSLLGDELVQQFLRRAVAAMDAKKWDEFEVSAFCLASLSDAVADKEDMDPTFHSIFLSPAFEDICFNRTLLPKRSRQTLADMIARYTPYFERNESTIPRTLNFLFNSLELSSCDRIASKSISTLCQNCRKALVVYVGEFINNFNALRTKATVSNMTLERVAEGVAAVIKALPNDMDKVNCLMSLLEPFERLAEHAERQWQQGQSDEALTSAVLAARCTASIGKGYRDSDDAVITLDAPPTLTYAADFWSSGAGAAAQACIVRIMRKLLSTFSFDGEIIEATCDALRAGYTETQPGPYVLPPEVTVDFVRAAAVVASPRFGVVMATATSFLASHALQRGQIAFGATQFILHIYGLILHMAQSADLYDPEVAHSCIDLLDHLLRKTPNVFYSLMEERTDGLTILGVILDFTIQALRGPDPLPLRSASSFWTALFSISDPPPLLQPSPPHRPQHDFTPTFFDQCLASLSAVLAHQISGNCARSDLDRLAEVIRKFVFRYQGAAKLHLGAALAALDAGEARRGQGAHLAMATAEQQAGGRKGPSKAERERFLAVLVASRGGRTTVAEVKAYWITCRGSGFAYA